MHLPATGREQPNQAKIEARHLYQHAIPWNKLTYDTSLEGFRTDITEHQLRGAPAYSRDRNYDWSDRNRERELHSHYGARPYWEP
jgi:hypothetical protein